MSFIDRYFQILSRLEDQLKNLTDESGNKVFDQIITGRKEAPKKYPCALIYPDPVDMRPLTTRRTERTINFTIEVVSKQPASRQGLEDASRITWRVAKMLEEDRTFGGLVERLELGSFTPEVERPRVIDRHESSLTVVFYVTEV